MQVYKDIFAIVALLVGGALAGYGKYLSSLSYPVPIFLVV